MSLKDAVRRRLPRSGQDQAPPDPRLDRLDTLVRQQATRLERQAGRIDRLARRVSALKDDAENVVVVAEKVSATLEIVARQLGGLESRVADLAERVDTPAAGQGAEVDGASALLAEIRTEHARIRDRFGVVTAFEERLRRLEEALVVDTQQAVRQYEVAARALAQELRNAADDGPRGG